MYGPISDVIPSTSIFEMYPIGFMTIAQYLEKHGFSVRIINVALKMLRNKKYDVDRLIKRLNPLAFGIDLHWLPHAHGSLELAKEKKRKMVANQISRKTVSSLILPGFFRKEWIKETGKKRDQGKKTPSRVGM